MKNLRSVFATLLFSTSCLLTVARGQITPSGDAYTNAGNPGTNYGSNALLQVVGSPLQQSYVQFPLSSIPTGASVAQATLKLYVNSVTTAGDFSVVYVTQPWAENTITSADSPAQGSAIVTGVSLTTASKNQYILIDITPAVVAWLNGSQTNYGVTLIPVGTVNASFDSKENTGSSHPPELDIVFGGDGTVTTVATGTGLTGGPITGSGTISLMPCSNGQILQWNGSAWACAAVGGTGTITGVTAGTDLTGGGTSGNVTISLNTANVPQLATANTFTANQTVNGNLSATGTVNGGSVATTGAVSAGTFQLGGALFGTGNATAGSAFLGFAGNGSIVGTANTGIGYEALHGNTSGGGNTASGYKSLAFNTTGNGNTASGDQALTANTTGGANNAIGAYALFSNTTGSNNIAIGNQALYTNNIGNANNAVGYNALYSNTSGIDNDASGAYSLYANTTGFGNVASGEGALGANTTGYHNAAVGFNSLLTTVSGSNNTGLGYSAGTDSTTTGLNNATAVGAWADVAESNAVVIGSIQGVNGCLSTNTIPCLSANVGIGTTTPAASLDVEAPSGLAGPTVNFGNSTNNATVTVTGNSTFTGNVNITGTITKGGGSFKIDDPLDPANKYLSHSFVESPDMMNVYNGNITTDKHGVAVVVLPDYFEALNQDFRYQLTVIGQFAQAIVLKKISNNRFTLKTNRPNIEVSWQVTGIRHDAYANAHRIPTEEDKPANEQGHYLHPELFGSPAEHAVGYRPTNPEGAENSGQNSTQLTRKK